MIDKTTYILSKFPNKSPNGRGIIHAHCPFHEDSKPSFSIDVNEGLFYCGSVTCGMSGNFPLFYKLMENISDWKSVYDILKSKTTNFNLNEILTKKTLEKKVNINSFPSLEFLEEIGSLEYLEQRGITREVIKEYSLFYGKKGRCDNVNLTASIIVPVFDLDGSYKTFQVRYLGNKSMRWTNPVGSPIQDLLYGGWLVRPEDKYLWIVEGASDVWRMRTFEVRAVGLNTKEASCSQLNKIVKLCNYFD